MEPVCHGLFHRGNGPEAGIKPLFRLGPNGPSVLAPQSATWPASTYNAAAWVRRVMFSLLKMVAR